MTTNSIKMRTNLALHPKVMFIARTLKLDAFGVVGRLHAFWAWADKQSEDGTLPYVTSKHIDDVTGKRGFAAALISVGWLLETPSGLTIPHFERYNGRSAKRRASENWRKRCARLELSRQQSVSTDSEQNTPKSRPLNFSGSRTFIECPGAALAAT